MAIEPEAQGDDERESADELFGELAHELTVLIRSDLELAAAEHAPALRQAAVDTGAAGAAAAAALLALAALSAAAVLGLTEVMSSWSAALVVAGTWTLVTVLLLRMGHVARLRSRLTSGSEQPAMAAAQRARSDAEQGIKNTSSRLARAMVRETAAHEVEAVVAAEQRIADTVERDVEAILRELVSALSVPDKAGSFLGRITGRRG